MAKFSYPSVNQELVWAGACAAFRINNGYVKWAEKQGAKDNKTLVKELLDSRMITADDIEAGQQVRKYISNVVTVAALKNTLDTWGQEMARVCQLDMIDNQTDISIIASMPATYARYLEREKVHTRLAETTGVYSATIGDKLELDVEVLDNRYSTKWATYYVTVVDTENRAWYFAHRQSLKKGSHLTIKGTVKRLSNQMTQLNRVKILEPEETV